MKRPEWDFNEMDDRMFIAAQDDYIDKIEAENKELRDELKKSDCRECDNERTILIYDPHTDKYIDNECIECKRKLELLK